MDDLIDPLLADYKQALDTGEWPGLDDTGDKLYTVGSWHLPPEKVQQSKATTGGKPVSLSAGKEEPIPFF